MTDGERWQEFTGKADTWWMDGDCPECGHVVYNNGRVRVCGEQPPNCEWWELNSGGES